MQSIGRGALLAFLVTVTGLAGCLDADGGQDDSPWAGSPLLARAEPLWHAPQDFPHPAWNWPTLTNPPAGDAIPAWWQPIAPRDLPDSINEMVHLAGTSQNEPEHRLPSGAGFAAFGSLVAMPTWSHNTFILDIADPLQPRILSEIEVATRGAAMIPYPDGTLVAVFATAGDVLVYDITDPTEPIDLGGLGISGSHKVGVVPGTPIVYNAASRGGGGLPSSLDPATATGVTEIYDLTDPREPVHVMDFQNGYSCHHVYFHINPADEKYRAVCAGIEYTQIWDIADPRDPQVIVNVSMPLGNGLPPLGALPLVLSHFSILSNDGTVLIVGDETGGGQLPACDLYLNIGGVTLSGPIGNLYFYDVSDEQNPELLSFMSPTHHYPSNPPVGDDGVAEQGGFGAAGCTAHHGRLVPDPQGRDLLAMAFYGAGVVLVDFTDAAAPFIQDQWNPNTNTWEVWYYNGYLLTGDLNHGMDVLGFE